MNIKLHNLISDFIVIINIILFLEKLHIFIKFINISCKINY